MNIRTCFDTLRVPRGVSLDEAKQSYKQLVKLWHPDQYGNDPEKQRIAHQKLTEINVAYREVVALLKAAVPQTPPWPETDKKSTRNPTASRTSTNKRSLFQRMASMFKAQNRETDAGRRRTYDGSQSTVDQASGAGQYPSSDFRQVLKRAIRSQPGRTAAGPTVAGRGKPVRRKYGARSSGAGATHGFPSTGRRGRGGRVEKIRPVRRVGKIGE